MSYYILLLLLYYLCVFLNNILILLLLISKRLGNTISFCDNNLCFVNEERKYVITQTPNCI